MLNNVISGTVTGISVDNASSSKVVIGQTAYQNNLQNVTANIGEGANALDLTLNDRLFVDPIHGNFYPAEGSAIIDNSLNWLGDRPELTSVRSPLGIPESPIVAPTTDLLGQTRVDDPLVPNATGLGENVFKDRGAIDRTDFVGPLASVTTPLDNYQPTDDSIVIVDPNDPTNDPNYNYDLPRANCISRECR